MTARSPESRPVKRALRLVTHGTEKATAPPKAQPPVQPAPKKKAKPEKPLPEPGIAQIEKTFATMASHMAEAASVAEAQRMQLTAIHGLFMPKASFVARFSSERDLLQIMAVRGRNDSRITAAAPGDGVLGRAFAEKSIVREDGAVGIPLFSAAGPVGAFVLVQPKFGASNELLTALAAQMMAASEGARLREESALRTKDLETAVAGLKAMEQAREELLANVSHDLKNPLTTIKTYLTLLQRDGAAFDERQKKSLQTVERNADRLLRMINDLLLVSRLQGGKMQLDQKPFGLKALAEEVVDMLSNLSAQSRVQLSIAPSAEVFVRGDRGHIREATLLLVENALHHSPHEGSVEIKISADAQLACLTVRDSGPGIAAEDLAHLFDGYRQPTDKRLRRASGLGLPIAAKIFRLHGGRIEAASSDGAGSVFRVYLPLFAGAVHLPEQDDKEPRSGGILLVEDDADCREVLQQVLEMEGYRVLPATTVSEAKALLEHIRPGMVLLDLRLSEEDGMSVLHFIRQNEKLSDVAVYLISGARDVASLSAGQGDDRIDGFFEKPLQVAKVLDTIAAVVRPTRRVEG